jgi:hypothetical protein
VALPLLAALFAGFSLVAMSLLQVGHYRPLLVLPLGLAAGSGSPPRRPGAAGGPRWTARRCCSSPGSPC